MKKICLLAMAAACAIAAQADKIQHPSLLFTQQRVEAAKQRAKTDTVYGNAQKQIIDKADALLQKNDVRQMEYLALAYQLTGDKKYADKIISMLKEVAKTPTWIDKEMAMRKPAWRSELQMAHKSFQLAVAYDAVYNDMSKSERKEIAEGLYRLAVEPLLGDWVEEPTRIHSLNSMGHNWWSSCVGMGGLLALAISNEVPQAEKMAKDAVESLPEWFDFAGDELQHKPKTFDRDGGMYESINYASFGITEALLLRLAWLNSHPGAKLEDIPQMQPLAAFFSQACYPRTGDILYSLNFGDSHKNVSGESGVILAYAMGEKDPDALWYINQVRPGQHREGFAPSMPMGFLYIPDTKNAPAEPKASKDRVWSDFGWATMRDSWEPDATMLAVKSGMTWNHAHADAGSMILYHKGHDIIKDAGNSSYGTPEYRKYFFQSDAHNVVKFNGKGQSTYQQYHGTMLPGTVTSLVPGEKVKYVLAEATGPTSDNFARNYRHFLWIDDVILVIDDLKSHEAGEYEWLWHPGGDAKKVNGDLQITNENSSVVIRPLYPQTLAPSNYVHDYPEMMYWEVLQGPREDLKGTEDYYSFKLPGQFDRVKGVTAIILKDSPDQKELPAIERMQGDGWIGLKITNLDGEVTNVYINELADGRLMHLNSWISCGGYDTDAYMLVEKGDDAFVCYGSALRKDGKPLFSSLSKLNFLQERQGDNLNVQISGQPRINASFSPSFKPKSIKVNGRAANLVAKDGAYKIKLNTLNGK
ncbi:MAG: heparinase II/III family protein [Clostridium sp.]|nr:heparinase II/III family protein [Clostridium sp.]